MKRRIPHRALRATLAIAIFVGILCTGCADGSQPESTEGGLSADSGRGGEDLPVLHLPVAFGGSLACTQGAGGAYSHSGFSTRHDLDFDTSNREDEELFAPAGGIAYVHTENARSGFGFHVNIDLGDGTYAVIGHMKEIFVRDREEVAAGELLGFEGATGDASGDHVHIGRHRGDPSRPAQFGESVSVLYEMSDINDGGGFKSFLPEEVVCGIRSLGDPVDGHHYRSALPIAVWHPDGTLVKTAYGPRVYLIDGGKARWITDESVFASLAYDFRNVTLISKEELGCLTAGGDIYVPGYVDARVDDQGRSWIGVGPEAEPGSNRRLVSARGSEAVMASWGLPYAAGNPPPSAGPDDPFFANRPAAPGSAMLRDGTLVTEAGTSDVYAISHGIALPIVDWQTYLRLGFGPRTILTVEDGLVAALQAGVGDCRAGVWCVDEDALSGCGDTLGLPDVQDDVPGVVDIPVGGPRPQPEDLLSLSRDQLGFAFVAPASLDPTFMEIYGAADAADGTSLFGEVTLARRENVPFLAWTSRPGQFAAGDTVRFSVPFETSRGRYEACEQGSLVGETAAMYGAEPLAEELRLIGPDDMCWIEVTIPEAAPAPTPDPDPAPAPVPDPDPAPAGAFRVRWQMPLGLTATSIVLSGELTRADGGFGLYWGDLARAENATEVSFALTGVRSGDAFRFSVEYRLPSGQVSWSCIGPYPENPRVQGEATATLDGVSLGIQTVGDPTGQTTGCGLIVRVP